MKIKKIIILVILILLLLNSLSISIATIDPNNFKPDEPTTSDLGNGMELAERIIGIITTVGIVISVVSLMVIGIKYMTGTIEERAEYKKTLFPILIGMILLFGTSWIVKLIYDIVPNGL